MISNEKQFSGFIVFPIAWYTGHWIGEGDIATEILAGNPKASHDMLFSALLYCARGPNEFLIHEGSTKEKPDLVVFLRDSSCDLVDGKKRSL